MTIFDTWMISGTISTTEELVAKGDWVIERWPGRGSYHGEFQGIAATGRKVVVPGAVFYRIMGGKIVEFRGQFDRLAMLEQLGRGSYTAQSLIGVKTT